jgi:hypothetical protein
MKILVTRPGELRFDNNELLLRGWGFHFQDLHSSFLNMNNEHQQRAAIGAALMFIADMNGIDLAALGDPAEGPRWQGLARDVLERAKAPRSRKWWQMWR